MAPQVNRGGIIVIGIDFGTTFTGVAYDYIKSDNQDLSDLKPQLIMPWPALGSGEANADCPKVPSRIAYPPGGKITWGHHTPAEHNTSIRWFKLLLLSENDRQSHLGNSKRVEQARQIIEKTGKDVSTIISDYLAKVWEHALEIIIRAWGQQFVSNHSFHVVITVPAIFQDYAVQRMERAVKRAGMLNKRPGCQDTTYAVCSEPEAAALAAIYGYGKYGGLKPEQTCVIADLGGGTVDLVSFKVKTTQPRLVLEEIVEGEGALCGAMFLDQAFLACIEKKVRQAKGKDSTLQYWEQMHELERKRILGTVWEKEIKRNYYDGYYDNQKEKGYRIDLGAQGKRRPSVLLDLQRIRNDLNHIFNSVSEKISKLVEGQVESIITKTGIMPVFIILTGGFGRCEYIYRKLRLQYKGRIEILFEANDGPWTAVARGAVLWGAAHASDQAQVESHVSRYSYGWVKSEDFNNRIHHVDDFDTDEFTGRWVARDQMEWVILRGESVKAQSREYEYERYFEADQIGFASFSEEIYRSGLRTPPKRKAENEERDQNSDRRAQPAEFQKLSIIDLTTPVPVEQLPKRGGRESPHRVLTYRVKVDVSGACLNIKATSLGREIGEKTIAGLSD